MTCRIKHPTVCGSVYIAEAVISRLEKKAIRDCGGHDVLYEQFFSREVLDFASTLKTEEIAKFIAAVKEIHAGYLPDGHLLISNTLNEIREQQE